MMKQNWLELEHKTFIVTGSASGIGRAIVEERWRTARTSRSAT